MSNWKDLLDRRTPDEPGASTTAAAIEDVDTDLYIAPDLSEYRPWVMQRGGGRPSMFIDLRRFEPKSGMLIGSLVSYPQLLYVDYIGDKLITLDLGSRQIAIEGTDLSELPMRLQQGAILAIQEFAPSIWRTKPPGPVVTRILRIDEVRPNLQKD